MKFGSTSHQILLDMRVRFRYGRSAVTIFRATAILTQRSLIVSLLALLAFAAPACSKDNASTTKPTTKPTPAALADAKQEGAHAPSTVKPGSHEDWCGEHQVPESQCTRCNPELIPAFKATGDWCAEHGLPESQCLKCNPDVKIVRPPKGS